MTERRGIQIPVWCSALCRNAYNEKCVEECSVNRDCSYFEEKPGLKLGDMPRFPETKEMTKEEKFTSVTVYLAKVVDHLQGREVEHTIYPPISRRQDFQNNVSKQNSLIKDLLPNLIEVKPGDQGKENE